MEPILEPLNFSYQEVNSSDNVSRSEENQVAKSSTLSSTSGISGQLSKALESFNSTVTTPCPFQSCSFELEGLRDNLCETYSTTQEFLKHLLVEHNLVLDNVSSIANLHWYLLHYREVFSQPNFEMENSCIAYWMDQPLVYTESVNRDTMNTVRDGKDGIRYKYYMLSDIIPEDKEIRSQIWRKRLETVLEINRLEREQNDFSYKCPLFCKEVCKGNRANLFLHMAQEHAFHVGQPDNIVFAKEFLEHIEKQLEELKCIYCEKTFKERAMLKEHMRKKQHKRINPLNPEYDRFYLVNYLEVGKTWQALQNEDIDEERVEEDWIELKDETNQIVCLFCPRQLNSFDETLSHMLTAHCFDFKTVTAEYNFYQKVKIVNCIRRNIYQNFCFYCESKVSDANMLLTHVENHFASSEFLKQKVWDQTEFLFPTYENDEFLMFLDENESVTDANMEKDMSQENPTIIPEDLSDIPVPPLVESPPDLDLELFENIVSVSHVLKE